MTVNTETLSRQYANLDGAGFESMDTHRADIAANNQS